MPRDDRSVRICRAIEAYETQLGCAGKRGTRFHSDNRGTNTKLRAVSVEEILKKTA